MDEKELDVKQVQYVRRIITWLADIIRAIDEPIDPKVPALLEIAHDIMEQQLDLDIAWEWDIETNELIIEDEDETIDEPEQMFLFFDNDVEEKKEQDEIPSPEELSKWFGDLSGDDK